MAGVSVNRDDLREAVDIISKLTAGDATYEPLITRLSEAGVMVTVRRDDLRTVLESLEFSSGRCHYAWERECADRLREAMS